MRRALLAGSGVVAVLVGIGIGAVVLRQSSGTMPHGAVVAATPAAAPAAPAPAQPPPPVVPTFDVVKIGPTGTAVIAGRAAPAAKVTVLDGGKPIGEATADGRGEWVVVTQEPLASADHQLSLRAADPKTGATVASDATVAVSRGPGAQPGGTAAAGGAPDNAIAVLLPRDGARPAHALQLPNGPSATTGLALDAVEYGAQGSVTLSGHAAPGATVRLYAGNEPLDTATADAAGKWSATPPRAIPAGRYELRLDEVGPDGTVAQRVAQPFERAAVDLLPGHDYVVQPGNNLWLIARRAYGAGTRYTIIYSANAAHIRDPKMIYPGQVFALPKS